MVRIVTILLGAFIATWSVAAPNASSSHEIKSHHSESAGSQKEPGSDHEASQGQQPFNTPSPDGEEEFDNKDETEKEKVVQRITTVTLTSVLEGLYQRQLLVFDEHQSEVDTPPPRF